MDSAPQWFRSYGKIHLNCLYRRQKRASCNMHLIRMDGKWKNLNGFTAYSRPAAASLECSATEECDNFLERTSIPVPQLTELIKFRPQTACFHFQDTVLNSWMGQPWDPTSHLLSPTYTWSTYRRMPCGQPPLTMDQICRRHLRYLATWTGGVGMFS